MNYSDYKYHQLEREVNYMNLQKDKKYELKTILNTKPLSLLNIQNLLTSHPHASNFNHLFLFLLSLILHSF